MSRHARRAWPKIVRRPREPKHARDTGPSGDIRRVIWARSGQCCERCGVWCATLERLTGEIHHRRNRSQGVDNSLANLVYLCHLCHRWVGSDPKAAHEQGFHLEHGELPEKARLLYGGADVEENGRRWALLANDGSREFTSAPTKGEVNDR